MKRSILLALCMCTFGMSFAQKNAKTANDPAKTQRTLVAGGKGALTGYFNDARNHPLSDVKVFIYGTDSSIMASGFTDVMGHYETNSVPKGTYEVKLVYPSQKAIMVSVVVIKPGLNTLSLKADAPAADANMLVTEVMPAAATTAKKK